jgi:hypothetical protein
VFNSKLVNASTDSMQNYKQRIKSSPAVARCLLYIFICKDIILLYNHLLNHKKNVKGNDRITNVINTDFIHQYR